jgi:hypothetical protein
VLEITAQYVPELKNKTVRVAGDGSCDLPLIGHVQAGGLSEEALTGQIAGRLKKYIYNPEVAVFVREYRSHQVAVVGAVKNPGLATLSGSRETILDMLKRAGGANPDAGDALILFPSTETANASQSEPKVVRIANAASSPDGRTIDGNSDASRDEGGQATAPQNLKPVIIPLHTTSLTYSSISLPTAGNFLQMPVRPGDLILVPGGGEMIRTDPSGAKRIIPINLAEVKKGHSEDPPVFPNDVIDVPYSKAKIGPYLLYGLVNRIGIGAGIPIP